MTESLKNFPTLPFLERMTGEMELSLNFDQLFALITISVSIGILIGYYSRRPSNKENQS